jgi:hypothetical protein
MRPIIIVPIVIVLVGPFVMRRLLAAATALLGWPRLVVAAERLFQLGNFPS